MLIGKGMLCFRESASAPTETTAADISVRVAGTTSFSGQAPEQKARMVAKLFEGLTQLGLAREDLLLRNVSFAVEKGLINKSAAAVFDVLVRVRDINQLGPTLGRLSESKLQVLGTTWIYGLEQQTRAALTATCIDQAMRRAEAVANTHGFKISLASVEDVCDADAHERPRHSAYGGGHGQARINAENAFDELPMTSFRDVTLSVKVTFELGPRASD